MSETSDIQWVYIDNNLERFEESKSRKVIIHKNSGVLTYYGKHMLFTMLLPLKKYQKCKKITRDIYVSVRNTTITHQAIIIYNEKQNNILIVEINQDANDMNVIIILTKKGFAIFSHVENKTTNMICFNKYENEEYEFNLEQYEYCILQTNWHSRCSNTYSHLIYTITKSPILYVYIFKSRYTRLYQITYHNNTINIGNGYYSHYKICSMPYKVNIFIPQIKHNKHLLYRQNKSAIMIVIYLNFVEHNKYRALENIIFTFI